MLDGNLLIKDRFHGKVKIQKSKIDTFGFQPTQKKRKTESS